MTRLTMADCLRRGPVWFVAVTGFLLMLSLRYSVVFGFGEEAAMLSELGLANLGLGLAVLAVLCAVPPKGARAVEAFTRVALTRAVPPWAIVTGQWLGVSGVMFRVAVVWCIGLALAMAWFAHAEPTVFTFDRDLTATGEIVRMLPGMLLAIMQGLLCAAVAVASQRLGVAGCAGAVTLLIAIGLWLPALPVAGWLVPDLRTYGAGLVSYTGVVDFGYLWGAAAQAAGWCGLVLAFAGWRMRQE